PVLDAVLDWLPAWEREMSHGDARGVANIGAIEGGFGWRASRTPHRTDLFLDLRVPPDVPMPDARRRALQLARSLDGVEAEVYGTAPGATIAAGHPLVLALAEAHAEVFGESAQRDVTRWFSDASVLTRYGIATVNYGASSGLPDAELGENLSIDELVRTAEVYARAAIKVCGVACQTTSTRCRRTCPCRRTTGAQPPCWARCSRSSRSSHLRATYRCASSRASGSCSTSIRGPVARGVLRRPAGTTSPAPVAARPNRALSGI